MSRSGHCSECIGAGATNNGQRAAYVNRYSKSRKIKRCSVDGCNNPVHEGNYFLCYHHYEIPPVEDFSQFAAVGVNV